jgi:hypothetical protein
VWLIELGWLRTNPTRLLLSGTETLGFFLFWVRDSSSPLSLLSGLRAWLGLTR